ncbi:hypothetical protein AVEN_94446-1 [Araneus ventricosus]|uniref:Uncharacterized protein n=1 Tax=Araneus ventricosus TaxID=182803 RepID=A0A4Y2G425_ARAVE|nr:hypothetical protein AVEN_94446-1 [Araneus ventricosus]
MIRLERTLLPCHHTDSQREFSSIVCSCRHTDNQKEFSSLVCPRHNTDSQRECSSLVCPRHNTDRQRESSSLECPLSYASTTESISFNRLDPKFDGAVQCWCQDLVTNFTCPVRYHVHRQRKRQNSKNGFFRTQVSLKRVDSSKFSRSNFFDDYNIS